MYKCRICSDVSAPGRPLIKHVVSRTVRYVDREENVRTRSEIAAEIPVCAACDGHLRNGETMESLLRYHQPLKVAILPLRAKNLPAEKEVVKAPSVPGLPPGSHGPVSRERVYLFACQACDKVTAHGMSKDDKVRCRRCDAVYTGPVQSSKGKTARG